MNDIPSIPEAKATAETSTDVRPDLVYPSEFGYHSSYVPANGVRFWTFDNAQYRDKFLAAVEQGRFRKKPGQRYPK